MPMSPYRRKYKARKNQLRRKRANRSRVGKFNQPVQYFKRAKFTVGALSVPVATTTLAGASFTLGDLPDVADFTALYDQYKIMGIKIEWLPRGNSSDLQSQNAINRFFSVLDRDDDGTPTSIDQLTQYESLKMTSTASVHKRYWKPSIRVEVPTATGGTGSAIKGPTWIDCTNTNVKHYGVKIGVQGPLAGTGSIFFDARLTMYLAFRNVR